MIRTIVQIGLLRLWHNKAELVLLFIVPICFFSVFALIFGSRGGSGGSTPKIRVAIADIAGNELSAKTLQELQDQATFRFYLPAEEKKASQMDLSHLFSGLGAKEDSAVIKSDETHQAGETGSDDVGQRETSAIGNWTREQAEDLVRRGKVAAAIILTPDEEDSSANDSSVKAAQRGFRTQALKVELMNDSYDQIASQVVTALLQKSLMKARAELFARKPPNMLPASSGKATEAGFQTGNQTDATAVQPASVSTSGLGFTATAPPASLPPNIELIDVLGEKQSNPAIVMYAAGIAVMFLLFSSTSASGTLLEERENSTLERLLSSRLTLDQLLMGKWCYMVLIGLSQMVVMFVWAQICFGVDLIGHLDGFIAMTIATVAAASSFALMMATACKTRTQLNWVSIVVILSMSALGGSMVPRYLMSESMQKIGLLTFNAWALDGYNKVFWREMDVSALQMELLVLAGSAFAFILLARFFASRWESA